MRFVFKVALALLIIIISASCTPGAVTSSQSGNSAGVVEIAPAFREFYQIMGGEAVLGPTIANPMRSENNLYCQYTENAFMCFDDTASQESERLFLYDLGNTFDLKNLTNGQGEYEVYEGFQELYDKLYGALHVGKALTPVQYNPAKHRLEQYFENVGFYQLYGTSDKEARLLSYGLFSCDGYCRYQGKPGSAIANQSDIVDLPFQPYIDRMFNSEAFGEPITKPFFYQNNEIQQVYDNVVFIGNPAIPSSVRLLNVPQILSMPQNAPAPQQYTIENNVVFYPTSGVNGYHVPLVFDTFLSRNGGFDLAGYPTIDVYEVIAGKQYRQCFANYCLDFDPTKPDGLNISMAPLGSAYLEHINLTEDLVVKFKFSPNSVDLMVSEAAAQISAEETQTINILALRKKDGLALGNVDVNFTLTTHDGISRSIEGIAPTDASGKTSVTIPAMPELKNGMLISYEVCLNVPSDGPICKQDNYMIWDH